jgi:urease accessory protein UreH
MLRRIAGDVLKLQDITLSLGNGGGLSWYIRCHFPFQTNNSRQKSKIDLQKKTSAIGLDIIEITLSQASEVHVIYPI